MAEYHPLEGLNGAGGEARRASIVTEAKHTIERHSCAVCESGSWCDTIVYAHHILTLNDIFVEQLNTSPDRDALVQAHHSGKLEGTAQALAVIGKAEGEFRTSADGNAEHPAFMLAETHRRLATTIRAELVEPTGRTALEIQARNEEASELSQYVREVSQQFKGCGDDAVAQALNNVAGDIAKGSDGVTKLRQAANLATEPEVLTQLLADDDPDVRWWAAQNQSTPLPELIGRLALERHVTVLCALIANTHVPATEIERFASSAHPEVAATAQRRLASE